jgi:hypothetical protein
VRLKLIMVCLALLIGGSLSAQAQPGSTPQDAGMEQRVALEGQPVALDSLGRAAIAARLLTQALNGTPDAPVRNARFIIENRSASFYNYVSGSVTFYDERGVRCGEGQFTLNALAPGEQAETDAPGLRLSCAPRTWRIVANNLLTRTSETVRPAAETSQPETPPAAAATTTSSSAPADTPAMMPLEIVVDDQVYSAPLGSTLEVPVRRRRVKITVRAAP